MWRWKPAWKFWPARGGGSGGGFNAPPAPSLIDLGEDAVLDLDDVDLLVHVVRRVERELPERRLHAGRELDLGAALVVQYSRTARRAPQRVDNGVTPRDGHRRARP